MKQIEKDALTIMLVHEFVKGSGKRIEDIVTNFDKGKFKELSLSLPFMQSAEEAEEALTKLTQESYKRIEKKFPKDK